VIRIGSLVAVCALGVLVWTGSSSGTTASGRPCIPNKKIGVKLYDRTPVAIYCGSAKATVHVQGKTYKFTDGLCFRVPSSFLIGVGKLTTFGTPKFKAFYLTAPATKDGTFHNQAIRYQLPGKDYTSATNKVVISGRRTRGTFSGRLTLGPPRGLKLGAKISGSFSCK
jgi:hypothetical protein